MAAETARRLACDASVVALIENDNGEPLNVGRKTRTISAPLRRVLNFSKRQSTRRTFQRERRRRGDSA
jgi:hypothetical protein